MRNLRSWKRVLISGLICYLIAIMTGCSIQQRAVFPASKLSKEHLFDARLESQEIWMTTDDGISINGLLFEQASEKVVLYLHGNGGTLDGWQYVARDFEFLGYDALVIDYRGYGKSSGTPSEEGVYLDSKTAYDYLVGVGYLPENIILYGRSLGTGVAVDLASKVSCHSVILESPFSSMTKMFQYRTAHLFPPFLVKHKFNSLDKITQLTVPILIIHGTADKAIPVKYGQRLYYAYDGPKDLELIEGAGHNNCMQFPNYKVALERFYKQYGG